MYNQSLFYPHLSLYNDIKIVKLKKYERFWFIPPGEKFNKKFFDHWNLINDSFKVKRIQSLIKLNLPHQKMSDLEKKKDKKNFVLFFQIRVVKNFQEKKKISKIKLSSERGIILPLTSFHHSSHIYLSRILSDLKMKKIQRFLRGFFILWFFFIRENSTTFLDHLYLKK